MGTVQIRNINPLGYVDVPLLGRQGPAVDHEGNPTEAGSGCLVPGEVLEVDEEKAGHAPHWRPSTEDDGVGDLSLRFETRVVDDALEVYDIGAGLLAQSSNFELVTGDGLDELTNEQLKTVAEERGIDLGGATKKADMLAAIRKA